MFSEISDVPAEGELVIFRNFKVKFLGFVDRKTQLYEYYTSSEIVFYTPPPEQSTPLTPSRRPLNYPPRDYDTIVQNSGVEIRALITEITSKEIKYRPYDQPDGPIRTIPIIRVSEIIHRNGNVEDIANKTTFGVSGDPLGFVFVGPEIGFELSKGNFNYQIQVRLPSMGNQNSFDSGFGIGLGANYLFLSRHNSYYLGGIAEYENHKLDDTWYHNGVIWGGLGWRYVHDTGINIRGGIDGGIKFGNTMRRELIWRPVFSIGYNF